MGTMLAPIGAVKATPTKLFAANGEDLPHGGVIRVRLDLNQGIHVDTGSIYVLGLST